MFCHLRELWSRHVALGLIEVLESHQVRVEDVVFDSLQLLVEVEIVLLEQALKCEQGMKLGREGLIVFGFLGEQLLILVVVVVHHPWITVFEGLAIHPLGVYVILYKFQRGSLRGA